jgi:hypothetical protein
MVLRYSVLSTLGYSRVLLCYGTMLLSGTTVALRIRWSNVLRADG